MVGQSLFDWLRFFIVQKSLSASQQVVGNVMYIVRIVFNFETSIKFLPYLSCKNRGIARGHSQGLGRGPEA